MEWELCEYRPSFIRPVPSPNVILVPACKGIKAVCLTCATDYNKKVVDGKECIELEYFPHGHKRRQTWVIVTQKFVTTSCTKDTTKCEDLSQKAGECRSKACSEMQQRENSIQWTENMRTNINKKTKRLSTFRTGPGTKCSQKQTSHSKKKKTCSA